MKRFIILLISVVILLCLVACGNNGAADNNSSTQSSQESTTSDIIIETKPTGDETNDIPPTIGNGNTNTEQGDEISNEKHVHTYKKVVITPTCEKDGFTSYSCDCGAQYTEDTVVAKGHQFGDWVEKTPATESAAGKEERKCKNCDKKETRDIPKLIAGHTHSYTSSITKEATCQTEGVKTFTCSCGAKYTERIGVTPHKYKTETVKPTCTSAGYTKHTCNCGKTYYDDTVKPISHNYAEVKTPATCTEGGYTTYTCKNCNYSYVGNKVGAKGHDYEDKVTKATCTTEGYTTHTCNTCGHNYVDGKTSAKGHNYEDKITKATCTTGGYTTHTCKTCGHNYVDNKTNAAGHKYEDTVVKATCTTKGYTTHKCKSCGDSYTDSYIEPSHTLVNYVCSICKEVVIPQGYTIIDKKSQLSNLNLNGKYILMADIDMGNNEWTPIGSKSSPFTGVFDGNGHTIKNFKISKETYYGGLFGYNKGTISKLGVEGISISLSNTEWDSIYAGAIAGYNGGTITDCYSTGTIVARSPAADFYPSYAGGLAGYNTGTITNCYSTCDVSASTLKYRSYAGGLVGYNDGTVFGYKATISNCYATGNIDSRSTTYSSYEAYADAVVGANYSGTVTNCHSNKAAQITEYNGSSAQFGSGPNKHTYAKDMSVLKSTSFQKQTLGWSDSVWKLVDGQHPKLK